MWKLLLLCYVTCCILLGHAVAEDEPTTLRGGILEPSDNCRAKVSKNARIKLHYTARAWKDAEPYETTYGGSPVSYTIGRDKIMKGLEQGIQGMCEGETRRLLIPADMAFGDVGIPGKVPPNSAVVYDVEMVSVNTPFTNPWFWTGLAVLAAAYIFVSRMASQVDQAKAERFVKKQQQQQSESAKAK